MPESPKAEKSEPIMSSQELTREAVSLLKEKGWECTPDILSCFQLVCTKLGQQGIKVDREMLDFVLDVIYVKQQIGLSADATEQEVAAAKETMVEWLEALGWRRDWFLRTARDLR
jgi:hypothetical protein